MQKSPSKHWGWLALGLLGASASAAHATDLSVNPSIHLSPTMKQLSPNSLFPEPALQGSWQISCSIIDQDTKYGFGDIELYYSVTVGTPNEVKVDNAYGLLDGALGGTPTASGDLLIQGELGGARLRPKLAGAFCHHGQQNSPLVDAWGQDIVVPPQVSVMSAYNPNRLNDPPVVGWPIGIDVVPDVPAGQPLVMLLNINAHPQGTESLVLHYENAGVSFTQVLYNIETDYKPDLERITPTIVGDNVKVWAEFRPTQTKSNVLQFHVIADPQAGASSSSGTSGASSTSGGTGGATGGTTAGVGTSGGPPKPGGCSSASGLELGALLGAAAFAARRRRR